ncbi:hypothetical protein BRARA_D01644 [Brassica rapa]|uniref:S-protein homolog n=1 Tax=Brassica campestris TaxID=3711 RepID=A0A397ZM14_BRACM|nr:hypothetical protein BRARA_D01644 [Brassica rapa]
MNLLFDILFLTFVLCFRFNEAKCHKNTLVFQNSLTLSKSTLKVHCKSKDNDLGDHFVKFNDPAYNFSFHDDVFFFTTEFNCYLFWKGANLVYHQTFIAYVGAFFFRCGALYVWNARDDAIYLSIDRKPEKIMYNWIKE